MAKAVAVLAAALLLLAAMGAGGAPAPAPQCDVSELSPCGGAFIFGQVPSESCCAKLREQEQKGCLCQYARDPQYSGFVDSATARKALQACKVAYPTC